VHALIDHVLERLLGEGGRRLRGVRVHGQTLLLPARRSRLGKALLCGKMPQSAQRPGNRLAAVAVRRAARGSPGGPDPAAKTAAFEAAHRSGGPPRRPHAAIAACPTLRRAPLEPLPATAPTPRT